MLESSRRVAEAKGYHIVFEETVLRPENCLPFLTLGHREQVVTIPYVQGRELLGFADFV